jgi:hypothetical protein
MHVLLVLLLVCAPARVLSNTCLALLNTRAGADSGTELIMLAHVLSSMSGADSGTELIMLAHVLSSICLVQIREQSVIHPTAVAAFSLIFMDLRVLYQSLNKGILRLLGELSTDAHAISYLSAQGRRMPCKPERERRASESRKTGGMRPACGA